MYTAYRPPTFTGHLVKVAEAETIGRLLDILDEHARSQPYMRYVNKQYYLIFDDKGFYALSHQYDVSYLPQDSPHFNPPGSGTKTPAHITTQVTTVLDLHCKHCLKSETSYRPSTDKLQVAIDRFVVNHKDCGGTR